MSFLDGLFQQVADPELQLADEHITESGAIAAGYLYEIEGSDDDIELTLSGLSVDDATGKRIGVKVIEAADTPPGGALMVTVPGSMLIEADDGSLDTSMEITDGQAVGNYREWLCDADGVWRMMAGASGGNALEIAEAGVAVGTRPTLNFAAGVNTTTNVTENPGGDRVDVSIDALLAVRGPSGPVVEQATLVFVQGDNVAISTADDVVNDEVEVTIAAKVAVAKAGVLVGRRGRLNLIEGSGVTITATDDAGGDEIDVTLAVPARVAVAKAGVAVGTRARLNLIEGTGITLTTADDAGGDEIDATIALTGFDPLTEIVPLHMWCAADVVESGGLVDTLTDLGSSPKNFTQTSTARAPRGTDGNGKMYLALDGSADYYQAGVAADWAFMHDGSAFTIAIVFHRNALLTQTEPLLDTSNGLSANSGMQVSQNYSSSILQGPLYWASRAVGGASAIGVSHSAPNTAIEALVIRHHGVQTAITVNGFTQVALDLIMRRNGKQVAQSARTAAHSAAAAANALTLGRSGSGSVYSAARIYEVVVDNKAWSDRQVRGWEDYARSRYVIAT